MVLAVTRPKAQGYGASLGDDWFRVAPSNQAPLRIYTRDSLAPRQDQKGSPEENVLDLGYAFSRSNLTGGEGLDWFPRIEGEADRETDKIRFWDSANIDVERPPEGTPYVLTLSKDSAIWFTPATAPTDMGASKDRLYVLVGQIVNRFNDTTDTTPDDTDDLGSALTQIAVGPDNSVAVLDTGGSVWYKAASTETYLEVYDPATDGPTTPAIAIWLAKGRIFAYCSDAAEAADGILLEIAPVIAGTPATPTEGAHVYTTIDTFAATMLDLIDAGHAIIASFDDGSVRSYVPQADTAGTTPVIQIRGRINVPVGEVPYALAWNLGTLLIFTLDNKSNARLYQTSVLDERFDFIVGPMQLIRTWENSGETSPNYVRGFTARRDSIHFWIEESVNTNNYWHFDVVTGGLHRHNNDGWPDAKGAVDFDDEFLWIDDGDIRQTDQTVFQPTGYLITPNITFGLNTAINWLAFVMEAVNLEFTGVRIELYRSGDPTAIQDPNHASWVLTDTLTDVIQAGVEKNITNQTSNSLALQVKLFASTDMTKTPELSRFAVRGLPKHRDWIAEVPINISDIVEAPGRMPLLIPGHGDVVHKRLLLKDGAATDLVVLDPPVTIRGVVDGFLEPVSYITDRGSAGRFAVMIFRGNRLTGTQGAQGKAGVGVGPVGIATVGIGEVS